MSWRPKDGWKNPCSDPHWNDDGEVSGMEEYLYEAGADALLEDVYKAITDAEFRSLESLGLSEFTEEQVKCFISYLRQYLGRKDE